jgi:hypothetical protein
MNEQEIDNIMQKHLKSDSGQINIDKPVMNRIRVYEDKRSVKILRFEYILSAIIFLSGIISIFFIQDFFNLYISLPQLELYIETIRWIFTGTFVLMMFITIFIIYLSSFFKNLEKI